MNLKDFFSNFKTKNESGNFDNLAYFFSALGDPTTLKILKILSKRKKLCVSDVAKILGASLSVVSHQMAKLKNLNLVRTEREGKMICYYLSQSPAVKILEKEFLKNAD